MSNVSSAPLLCSSLEVLVAKSDFHLYPLLQLETLYLVQVTYLGSTIAYSSRRTSFGSARTANPMSLTVWAGSGIMAVRFASEASS